MEDETRLDQSRSIHIIASMKYLVDEKYRSRIEPHSALRYR